ERLAFLFGPTLEVGREPSIDIERWPPGVGMANHHRVYGILRWQFWIEETILSGGIGSFGLDAKNVGTRGHRSPPPKPPLQPTGKRIVGLLHAREHRVAPTWGEFAGKEY